MSAYGGYPGYGNLSQLMRNIQTHEFMYAHVPRSTHNYPDLKPQFGVYTYETGRRSELLFMTGTIPVFFRGVQYNIPVCIWLPDTYPDAPPLCYVAPTPEMAVKPGKHVDSNGKVYLPYLHTWRPTAGIVDLVANMCLVFGQEPPVYSRPKNSPAPPPQPYGGYQPPTSSRPPPAGPPQPVIPPRPKQDEAAVDDSIIRQSLESFVLQKIQADIRALYDTKSAIMTENMYNKQQLQAGEAELNNIFKRINESQAQAQQSLDVLKTKDQELTASITALEASGEIDVDAAVDSTTPVYRQLMELVALDNALEDTIYQLGKGLEYGTIDLPVYLKNLRMVSRKQFSTRALISKARETAHLS